MIRVDGVSKKYGRHEALQPTSLTFADQETTVLIGPSGCGKSTLLRVIMGLIQPDTGTVQVGDVTVSPGTIERIRHSIGYVIQDGGLFPHLSAERNVTLLARHLGWAPDRIAARVEELATLTRLSPELVKRFPVQLSGGQRQRVGLMRALMLDPPVLLLDEPLGALDPITRYELQTELKEIFARLQKTVVMVTHDMGEAAFFGDRIVVMRSGQVVQAGGLEDLIRRPSDAYVTAFIRAQRPPASLMEATA